MTTAGTYDVIQHDDDDNTERSLGVVTLDATGMLGIVSLEPDEDEQLQTIVEELNDEDTMHEDAQPPEGARQFEVFSRMIKRGTDGFVPALLEHLQRYHGIELRPK